MRNSHGRTWNMVRKTEHVKMRNAHCNTWNMTRNIEKRAKEKHTLQDLEYGEKL